MQNECGCELTCLYVGWRRRLHRCGLCSSVLFCIQYACMGTFIGGLGSVWVMHTLWQIRQWLRLYSTAGLHAPACHMHAGVGR